MNSSKINLKLLDLACKPTSYQFNKKEMAFLRKHVSFDKYRVIYCLFAQKSSQNRYVGFFVDSMKHNPRGRTPAHYSMNVIAERPLNKAEKEWELQNYGTTNRRFVGSWVSSILWVIDMDKQYGVETPKKFIDICTEKGYTMGLQKTLQL